MIGVIQDRSAGANHAFSMIFTLFVLYVGFSDGLGYYLRDHIGIPSPHILTIPVLVLVIFFYWLVTGRSVARGAATQTFGFVVVMFVWLIMQVLFYESIHLLGYGQLVLFVMLLILVKGIFATAPPWLTDRLPGTIVFIHYLQCGYVLLTFAAWHLVGLNLNLLDFLQPVEIQPLYEFRPAGLSREPSWAAFALGSTYLGIHYLVPRHRNHALLAFLLAALLLNSGTAYVLLVLFGVAYLAQNRSAALWIVGAFIAIAGIGLLTVLQWDRLVMIWAGYDPSFSMRLASATVAIEVIRGTFPLGTGYGNFRDFGVYGTEFYNFIDLSTAAFYKSDISILNLIAELGVGGIIIVTLVMWIFMVRRNLLPLMMISLLMVGFGTLLVPPLLLIAAIIGTLERRKYRALGVYRSDRPMILQHL